MRKRYNHNTSEEIPLDYQYRIRNRFSHKTASNIAAPTQRNSASTISPSRSLHQTISPPLQDDRLPDDDVIDDDGNNVINDRRNIEMIDSVSDDSGDVINDYIETEEEEDGEINIEDDDNIDEMNDDDIEERQIAESRHIILFFKMTKIIQ
jgi:hypothetical protein